MDYAAENSTTAVVNLLKSFATVPAPVTSLSVKVNVPAVFVKMELPPLAMQHPLFDYRSAEIVYKKASFLATSTTKTVPLEAYLKNRENTTVTVKMSDLAEGTTYQMKVRLMNANGMGAWSRVLEFKVENSSDDESEEEKKARKAKKQEKEKSRKAKTQDMETKVSGEKKKKKKRSSQETEKRKKEESESQESEQSSEEETKTSRQTTAKTESQPEEPVPKPHASVPEPEPETNVPDPTPPTSSLGSGSASELRAAGCHSRVASPPHRPWRRGGAGEGGCLCLKRVRVSGWSSRVASLSTGVPRHATTPGDDTMSSEEGLLAPAGGNLRSCVCFAPFLGGTLRTDASSVRLFRSGRDGIEVVTGSRSHS